jgi:signal peptidase
MLKKVFQWLATLVLVVVVLACVGIFVAPHFGWHLDIVYGGSMEPAIKIGSLVVIKPVQPQDIKVDDIITYRSAAAELGMVTTHRVIEVMHNDGSLVFRTKGDANEDPDINPVAANELVGKLTLDIPYLGYLELLLRTRLGMILLIGLPVAAIIGMELRNIRKALAERKEGVASDCEGKEKRIRAGTLSADDAVLNRKPLASKVALGLGVAAAVGIITIVVFFCAT